MLNGRRPALERLGQFHAEGTCAYADDRQFAPTGHAAQFEATSPAL
jgi:hypothetical protein